MTKLKVLTVGSGAGNVLTGIKKSEDVEFWAINTDKRVLNCVEPANKLQIGKKLTNGLGSGGNPLVGEKAAEENASDISEIIRDTDTIITVACLGGGTGSGAAPVIIQKIAEETNVVNLAIITLPFSWEGNRKMQQALESLENIKKYADKVIVIENNQLIPLIDKKVTCKEAFIVIDKVIGNWINKINDFVCDTKIVDFNSKDLKKFFKYKGNLYAETIDIEENNFDMIDDKIKKSTILSNLKLAQNSAMVIYVKGSLNSTLHEVHEIMDKLSVLCNDYTQVYFCVTVDEDIKEGCLNISLLLVNNE